MHVVLGGGISGLSAAHYLLKSGLQRSAPQLKIVVVEGSGRVGGWIQTSKHNSGLLFEQGPRTVRPNFEAGSNTLELVEELNIDDLVQGIPRSHPTAKNRMIFVNGSLHTLPSSFQELFVKKPPFSKSLAATLIHDFKTKKKVVTDESIYSFVERRFGHELADYAISSMICGICAGDAKEISVKFLAKRLLDLEQKYGSVTKGFLATAWKNTISFGSSRSNPKTLLSHLASKAKDEKWSVWSLRGGLEILPQALLNKIQSQGAQILLNTSCSKIQFTDRGAQIITDKESVKAQHIISTVSAQRLAPMVSEQHPILSEELSKIPSVTVAVVNLAYRGNVLKHNAFGFLIPPLEERPILGVIFDTCSFPQENFTVLTVMMGGRWFESRFGSTVSNEHLLNVAITQVRAILEIPQHPCHHQVSVLQDCIPQYIVGHHERIKKIRNYILKHRLPLSLAGSSYDGVGVNDVIFSAKQAVELLKLKQ